MWGQWCVLWQCWSRSELTPDNVSVVSVVTCVHSLQHSDIISIRHYWPSHHNNWQLIFNLDDLSMLSPPLCIRRRGCSQLQPKVIFRCFLLWYCINMTLLLSAVRMKSWNNISRFLLLTSIITNHQFLYQFNASWNGNKLFLNCTLLLLWCWSSYFCDSRCWCSFNCSLSSEYPGSDWCWCWLCSSFCHTNSKSISRD